MSGFGVAATGKTFVFRNSFDPFKRVFTFTSLTVEPLAPKTPMARSFESLGVLPLIVIPFMSFAIPSICVHRIILMERIEALLASLRSAILFHDAV